MAFKNEAQLKRFLLKQCKRAVANAEKEVYQTFDRNINNFYGEFHPDQYKRTGKLSNSLAATEVTQIGDGVYADVWFDASGMDYTTGSWSGETVLQVALNSAVPHGGYAGGTAIFEEGMLGLYDKGGVKNILKQNLIAQGLPIE